MAGCKRCGICNLSKVLRIVLGSFYYFSGGTLSQGKRLCAKVYLRLYLWKERVKLLNGLFILHLRLLRIYRDFTREHCFKQAPHISSRHGKDRHTTFRLQSKKLNVLHTVQFVVL